MPLGGGFEFYIAATASNRRIKALVFVVGRTTSGVPGLFSLAVPFSLLRTATFLASIDDTFLSLGGMKWD